MFIVYLPRENHTEWIFGHDFSTKRDAKAFSAKWNNANPGQYSRVQKVGA